MTTLKLRGIAAGPAGIIWYSDDELDRSVWVRVREAADGRYEVIELYLDDFDGPITTDHLRQVPLGRIEAFANSPEGRAQLRNATGTDQGSLSNYVAAIRQSNLEITRRRPPARRQRLSSKLPVPADRRSYGDDFYRQVARLYAHLAELGEPPAPAIAEANDVPLTTARRWVREARRRGFLGPGRAGKVG